MVRVLHVSGWNRCRSRALLPLAVRTRSTQGPGPPIGAGKNMKKLFCVFGLILVGAGTAAASSIALGPLTVAWYDQQDSPCFIGYSCGPNQGIAYTTYSGQNEGTDLSPVYTTSADPNVKGSTSLTKLIGEVGTNPLIAIDINQNGWKGGAVDSLDNYYTIDYIKVYINENLAYAFGGATVPQSRTGNGVSDYVISGLDLAGANSLQFEVAYGNFANLGNHPADFGDNNDGKDLFFLVKGNAPQVPEPATLLLLGTGLSALGLVAWRRKK
jgi:hypothetical protein